MRQAIPEQAPIVATFATAQQALDYRAQHGGWVFINDKASNATWFDASMFTPSGIMRHSMTRGQSGKLI